MQFISVLGAVLGFDMMGMAWLGAFLIGAGCFALGCLIGARRSFRAAAGSSDAGINDEGRKKINRENNHLRLRN